MCNIIVVLRPGYSSTRSSNLMNAIFHCYTALIRILSMIITSIVTNREIGVVEGVLIIAALFFELQYHGTMDIGSFSCGLHDLHLPSTIVS